MKVIRVAVVAIGVLVIAAAIVAACGIPARGLIKSYAGGALAADELKLDIAGDARVVLFPTPASPSGSSRCGTPQAVTMSSPSSAYRPASR